jgi:dTDP-4-dehydrorhamnose reductase
MRLLVFGGWGQLGSDLALAAQGRHEMVRPRREEVDVTDAGAVEAVAADLGPDVVVEAAAFHRVDQCETDPASAFAVNALGALNVARAARRAGARCVYIGTDYVFDGSRRQGYAEDAPMAPLNVYGVSKAAGERLVRTACPDSLVVRGSGMFGHAGSSGKGANFVEAMLAKAAAGERVTVVDDLVFSPTATRDMAERILLLLERDVPPGTYHAANSGSCSWYGFARAVFELAGIRADLSPRVTGLEAEEAVLRPRWSILLDTRSAELGLPPSRSWEEALDWYLEARPQLPVGAAAEGTG